MEGRDPCHNPVPQVLPDRRRETERAYSAFADHMTQWRDRVLLRNERSLPLERGNPEEVPQEEEEGRTGQMLGYNPWQEDARSAYRKQQQVQQHLHEREQCASLLCLPTFSQSPRPEQHSPPPPFVDNMATLKIRVGLVLIMPAGCQNQERDNALAREQYQPASLLKRVSLLTEDPSSPAMQLVRQSLYHFEHHGMEDYQEPFSPLLMFLPVSAKKMGPMQGRHYCSPNPSPQRSLRSCKMPCSSCNWRAVLHHQSLSQPWWAPLHCWRTLPARQGWRHIRERVQKGCPKMGVKLAT